MDAKKIATHLARKVFEVGDDGPDRHAVRLQYKTGSLTNERDGGGLIEASLARFLEHELERYLRMEVKLAHEKPAACLAETTDGQQLIRCGQYPNCICGGPGYDANDSPTTELPRWCPQCAQSPCVCAHEKESAP